MENPVVEKKNNKRKFKVQDENLIQAVFVDKSGKKELGCIYKSDIDLNGDCKIYVFEKKNKKTGKKTLYYTSSEEEYLEATKDHHVVVN